MSAGTFTTWQPAYAAHGIATFPVEIVGSTKKPAVTHYARIGHPASEELARKFVDAGALGCMAGRRSRLFVADLDDTDEAIVAEGERMFGASPVMWRTGGGKFALAYRHTGERRLIRPISGLPIDLLGDGVVVLPPSAGVRQPYELIRGTLADLDRLPVARIPDEIRQKMLRSPLQEIPTGRIVVPQRGADVGHRNNSLWLAAMYRAPDCSTEAELLAVGLAINDGYSPPLDRSEVEKIVRQAWQYEQRGKNLIGQNRSQSRPNAAAAHVSGDAAVLLPILRRAHSLRDARGEAWGASPAAMAKAGIVSGWGPGKYRKALAVLVEPGLLEITHQGGRHPRDPRKFKFGAGQKMPAPDAVKLETDVSKMADHFSHITQTLQNGASIRQAAAQLGISKSAVHRIAHRAEAPIPKKPDTDAAVDVARVVDALASGASIRETAAQLGIDKSRVLRLKRRAETAGLLASHPTEVSHCPSSPGCLILSQQGRVNVKETHTPPPAPPAFADSEGSIEGTASAAAGLEADSSGTASVARPEGLNQGREDLSEKNGAAAAGAYPGYIAPEPAEKPGQAENPEISAPPTMPPIDAADDLLPVEGIHDSVQRYPVSHDTAISACLHNFWDHAIGRHRACDQPTGRDGIFCREHSATRGHPIKRPG